MTPVVVSSVTPLMPAAILVNRCGSAASERRRVSKMTAYSSESSSLVGGTNFQAPSYSPVTGWLYLQYRENGQVYVSAPQAFEEGRQYIGRQSGAAAAGPKAGEPASSAGIKALDPETGKTMWDFKIFQGSLTNGVLATAGNVVFGGVRDGNVVALDARSGRHLWHFQTGANIAASPISFAVDGRQFIAISAGNTLYAFALPDQP